MKFKFTEGPTAFNKWLIESCLNELHVYALLADMTSIENAKTRLRPFAVEYFKSKGLESWMEDGYIWFNIDKNDTRWASQ